jgi:hypothetical protein
LHDTCEPIETSSPMAWSGRSNVASAGVERFLEQFRLIASWRPHAPQLNECVSAVKIGTFGVLETLSPHDYGMKPVSEGIE